MGVIALFHFLQNACFWVRMAPRWGHLYCIDTFLVFFFLRKLKLNCLVSPGELHVGGVGLPKHTFFFFFFCGVGGGWGLSSSFLLIRFFDQKQNTLIRLPLLAVHCTYAPHCEKRYAVQHAKRTLMHFSDNRGPDRGAHLCSLIWAFSVLIYTTVSTDSVSRQWRPRSACTYVQADQGLHCLQIA